MTTRSARNVALTNSIASMGAANAKRVVTSVVVADALPAVRLALKLKALDRSDRRAFFLGRKALVCLQKCLLIADTLVCAMRSQPVVCKA